MKIVTQYTFLCVSLVLSLFSCGEALEPKGHEEEEAPQASSCLLWVNEQGEETLIKKEDRGNWTPTNGILSDYWDNGNLKKETPYKNGKVNGLLTTYDSEGVKLYELEFKDSKADSVFTMYYSNGQVQLQASMQTIGESFLNAFDRSGNLQTRFAIDLSNPDLKHEISYYPNGRKKSRYIKDSLIIWDKDGQVLWEEDSMYYYITQTDFEMFKKLVLALSNDEDVDRPDLEYGCLAGDCENGQSYYTYGTGISFNGEFRNGLPNGKAAFLNYKGMPIQEGTYKDGLLNGYGEVTEGNLSYEGIFENGLPCGKGKMVFEDGTSFIGIFKNGIPNDSYGLIDFVDGDRYEGSVVNGEMNGEGRMIFSTGETLEGYYKNGEPVGKALFYEEDGSIEVRNYGVDGYTVVNEEVIPGHVPH